MLLPCNLFRGEKTDLQLWITHKQTSTRSHKNQTVKIRRQFTTQPCRSPLSNISEMPAGLSFFRRRTPTPPSISKPPHGQTAQCIRGMRESSDRDSCELQPLFQKRGLRAMTEPPQARSTIPLCAYTPPSVARVCGLVGGCGGGGGQCCAHTHTCRCFEKLAHYPLSAVRRLEDLAGRAKKWLRSSLALQSSLFLCPLK